LSFISSDTSSTAVTLPKYFEIFEIDILANFLILYYWKISMKIVLVMGSLSLLSGKLFGVEASSEILFLTCFGGFKSFFHNFYTIPAGCFVAKGNSKPKVLPSPILLVTNTRPPCTVSTICFTRFRPRPVPSACFLLAPTL